jgi:diguanylate cyclase (GGDEF)-like protein
LRLPTAPVPPAGPGSAPAVEGARARRSWYQLEDRHRALFIGRAVAWAGLAVAAATASTRSLPQHRAVALAACLGALALHALLAWAPQRWPARLRFAVDASLVVDAGALAALAWASGGSDSPALRLLPLFALAVTLGYSARTGLKAAVLAAVVVLALLANEDRQPFTSANWDRVIVPGLLVAIAAAFSAVSERELRRRGDRLSALHEASNAFLGESDRGALVRIAEETAARLLPDWTVAVRLDDLPLESREPTVRAWREEDGVHVEVAVLGGRQDPGGSPRRLGVLAAERPAPGGRRALRLRGQQLVVLQTLANTLGGALDRAELLSKLEHLSVTDALTGLGNRRAFEEALEVEMGRARRTGLPVSLVLLDLDRFKTFNDLHGHQAGDAALVAIGRVLHETLRAEDRACRYGGEEFALLLPATGPAAAADLAERVRGSVEASPLPDGNLMTVSLGVASDDGRGAAETLVATADARLYTAKRRGRNRVVMEDEQPSLPTAPARPVEQGAGGVPG